MPKRFEYGEKWTIVRHTCPRTMFFEKGFDVRLMGDKLRQHSISSSG